MRRASRRRAISMLLRALAAGALASLAAAAPGALAQGPAVDQYELDIPRATGAGAGAGKHDGSSGGAKGSGGGGEESTPVPQSGSTPIASTTSGEPAADPAAQDASGGGKPAKSEKRYRGPGSGGAGPSPLERSARTVPAIAADTAGQSGVLMLLAGLATLGALAAFLVHRRRRAGASGA